jgi:hypothetical protein
MVGTVAAADNKKRRENTPEDVLLVTVAIDGVSLTQRYIDGQAGLGDGNPSAQPPRGCEGVMTLRRLPWNVKVSANTRIGNPR